ncbi:hypothetical protein [Catenuloplanes indicus]|uniref:Uncharacterized protein n=1 Tax=Catenuloplanes indicus TaxID=137267 RepID=A0AAE3VXT7_9ACTN|nr:hypothetical protein [Catenuloplanes indicus]MDQ0365724.1 hypothetical protein [Catenuloplanes indicus]
MTAVDGNGLFAAVGAKAISTACYRGYVASYRVDDDHLVLAELVLQQEIRFTVL